MYLHSQTTICFTSFWTLCGGINYFVNCIFCWAFFFKVSPSAYGVPRLGVKLALQLPAYTVATVTWDPSHISDLHHSSWRCRISGWLSDVRDRTYVLMDTSLIYFHCATTGTPCFFLMAASMAYISSLCQGLKPSHICDLHHGCSNVRCLTHCATVGTSQRFCKKDIICICLAVVCSYLLLCSTLLYEETKIYKFYCWWHLDCFQVLGNTNNAAMSFLIHVSWGTWPRTTLEKSVIAPRNVIAGRSALLDNCQSVIQRDFC